MTKLGPTQQVPRESIGEFLLRCNEPPICTVRNHQVYSLTMNDVTSYVVVQVGTKGDYKATIGGYETLDKALEQIIEVYKRHLLEIGWRDRQTLKEQGYYAWEKEVAKVN